MNSKLKSLFVTALFAIVLFGISACKANVDSPEEEIKNETTSSNNTNTNSNNDSGNKNGYSLQIVNYYYTDLTISVGTVKKTENPAAPYDWNSINPACFKPYTTIRPGESITVSGELRDNEEFFVHAYNAYNQENGWGVVRKTKRMIFVPNNNSFGFYYFLTLEEENTYDKNDEETLRSIELTNDSGAPVLVSVGDIKADKANEDDEKNFDLNDRNDKSFLSEYMILPNETIKVYGNLPAGRNFYISAQSLYDDNPEGSNNWWGIPRNCTSMSFLGYSDDKMYTEKFFDETKEYKVLISDYYTGILSVGDKTSYKEGETVRLTITPEEGKELSRLIVEGNSVDEIPVTNNEFIMPGCDVTVYAFFIFGKYNVNLASDITNGTVKLSRNKVEYDLGVDITIFPDSGYELDTLTVTDSKGNNIVYSYYPNPVSGVPYYSFDMPSCDVTVNCTFKAIQYKINPPNNIENGTISADKNTAAIGDKINITTTPAAGYELNEISVKDSKGNSLAVTNNEFTMPADEVIISGSFKPISYNVGIAGGITNGTVAVNKTTASIGETVSLTATPATGYEFDAFTVKDANGTSIPVTNNMFTMPASNVTISGSFKAIIYKVNIADGYSNGTVSVNKTGAVIGDVIKISTAPDTGYVLNSITVKDAKGNDISVSNNEFTMPAGEVIITCSFRAILYNVSITAGIKNGTISVSQNQAVIGSKIRITTSPATGYEFNTLTVKDSSGNNITVTNNEFTMPASDVTISCTFKAIIYNVNLTATTNGTFSVDKTQAVIGDVITITTSAATGFTLNKLTVEDTAGNILILPYSSNQFTMPASNVTVTASFIEKTYSISIADSITNGTVSIEKFYAVMGAPIRITTSPATGYEFNTLTVKDSSGNNITVTNNEFTMPASDVTISCTFKAIIYNVNLTATTNGTFSVNKSKAIVGDKIIISTSPSANYELATLVVKDSNNNNIAITDNEFTMPASDVTISCTFQGCSHNIIIDDGITNGSVDVVSTAGYNSPVVFTIVPEKRYRLDSFVVKTKDGTNVPLTNISDLQYTFTMPAKDVTISASFVQKTIFLKTGPEINSIIKNNLSANRTATSFINSRTPPENMTNVYKISTENSETDVLIWLSETTIYYYAEGYTEPYNPTIKMPLAADASQMFYGCSYLTKIDMKYFDTSNVTDMSKMFYENKNLKTLIISAFDTSNVTDMSYMFYYCDSLTSLNVSGFNTSKVTDMSYMFYYCRSLTSLNVSGFKTSNVTNMSYMFYLCEKLTSLDLSGFNTSKVTDMSYMFYSCDSITALNVSGFDTSNVTNMSHMFGCKKLTSLNVSGFNTSKVTDMSGMFYMCLVLSSLDLSGFDTSKVTDMSSMFCMCKELNSLKISNFVTSNVTNLSNMFMSCENLKSLNLSHFNTSNVTNMSMMFYSCTSLYTLDISSFNTSKVTNMSKMFTGCHRLSSLDLTNFDTASVTDMSFMFGGCFIITSLDLSGFDTSNVKNMMNMFDSCKKLVTIYASENFVITNYVQSEVNGYGTNMFDNCSALKGGAGTEYATGYTSWRRACIDDPDNGAPGYFTLKP